MVSTKANHPEPANMRALARKLELSFEEMDRLARAMSLEEK